MRIASIKSPSLGLTLVALLGSAVALTRCAKVEPPPSETADMAAPSAPDLLGAKSDCGHPGDKGNSLGVGKFCTQLSDCSENSDATLCTTLGDDRNFFCTLACSRTGPANQCGEDATCECSSGGCGCFPNSCADSPVDGGADLQTKQDQGP